MAIYRAEQARLSFAGEAGAGGYIDQATGTASGTGASTLNGATLPGARSVTAVSSAGYAADEYIQIGTGTIAEVRRIRRVTGNVIYLDYPLAFPHANGVALAEVAAAFSGTSYLTFFPGVYESISVPDMVAEITPHYVLSTSSNRNWHIAYRGRQSFSGSLNFILLNGFPLRFPLGTVATVGTATGTGASTLSAASAKGDLSISVVDGTGYSNAEFIQVGTGTVAEVRQISSGANGAGAQTFVLNYPLMIAHANASVLGEVTSPYTHTIYEAVDLDSISWHLLVRDSGETAANDFIRRFVGGKVGRATISADEGGLLMCAWDDVQFLDLAHNQRFHSSVGGGTTEIVRYNGALVAPTVTLPTTQPYYFSQGTLSLFGVTFARIRNFRLEINNNPTSYYYIRDDATERIPSEIREQRREYRMAATIAMPDSLAATATTRTLFKELLLEGNYGASFTGFDLSLTFTRGTNDTITITIPPSAAAAGGDAQGAFFRRGTGDIGGESPIQVAGDILFRSMRIAVVDAVGVYP